MKAREKAKEITRLLFWFLVACVGMAWMHYWSKHWGGSKNTFPQSWSEVGTDMVGVFIIALAMTMMWRPVGTPIENDDDEPRCPLCKR